MDEESVATLVGEPEAFAAAVETHRHELRVHCYRLLGSFHDAEDLVQETFLRAWRRRGTLRAEPSLRAWLHKVATLACLDLLDRENRRVTRYLRPPLVESPGARPPLAVGWLEPYPDRLLDAAAPADGEPGADPAPRETIELAFVVALQQLSPWQRAVLVLRDVLGWSTNDTSALLDRGVTSVASALQRARLSMRVNLAPEHEKPTAGAEPGAEELALVRRLAEAHERADLQGIADLLAADVQQTIPSQQDWLAGRAALMTLTARDLDPTSERYQGERRSVLTWANRQPALAHYVQRPSAEETREMSGEHRAQGLDVITVAGGEITAITTFGPRHLAFFDLPLVLP
ncbi:RNA polymerase subunit sigma-70 [Nocardioides sp. zg-DK7169]|uniref:RNA polymerase subunit sigma-70 n=1 Tax=Nocardioides sp. zg-DK7169 TaxID=2736600 RepID=UPI001556CC83|nr:RNA polymerase subunit sigma-70 [Nocardioides sp. zg-DK7169]NPC96588.1 RNA polymerase subunit sigma-70 [Nocardioides sp. zg-DK7169]